MKIREKSMANLLKIRFFVLFICSLLNILSSPLLSFQTGPYAGLTLEYQRIEGHRIDSFLSPAFNERYDYLSYQDFDNNKVGFEVFTGWLFPFCSDCFLVGYEGYVAYDFNKNTAKGTAIGILETSSLRHNFNTGFLFKAGLIVCENYFIYGLVGPDIGYFTWTQTEEGGDRLFKKQAVMGVRFGAGIERDFRCFRIGLQVDYTHYNPKTFSTKDSSGNIFTSYFKPNVLNVGLRLSVPLR